VNHRLTSVAALLVGAVLAVGGCSSSGGSPKHNSSSAPPSSSSISTPSTPTSSSTAATPAPSWTPPTYGAAQPAVSAFLALDGAQNKAFEDPQNVSSAAFDKYVIGSAKTLFDAALFNEKQADRYYKGTPAQQRVTVRSTDLTAEPKSVVLYSCPLANASDPFTEYDAKTGKPVPAGAAPKVPPPYGKKIKVIELSGQWLVSEFTTDATKTCTP
jgi:hypothetical protein